MTRLPFDDEEDNRGPEVHRVPGEPGGPAPDRTTAHAPIRTNPHQSAPVRTNPPLAPDRTGAHPFAPAAPGRKALTVSELSARIRDTLESGFDEVWVEGELSNGRVWNTGHYYFTLKDPGAQIKGVMFGSKLRLLKFKPEDGLRVVARGRVSVYEPKGEYQLVCEHMAPHGFGPLQIAFEQLKKRLAAEGLFDQSRKRALPALPRRIGIVTSIDGAALRDIVRVLRRRYPNAHLVVAPCRVQGDGASGDIARALRQVSRIDHVDVVIVGRGGGSLEDLWAFNEEKLARAIASCPVPVISAVGHETDVTIADFVADLRAPTPSAAAELVVRKKDEFSAQIDRLEHRLRSVTLARVRRLESRLHALDARPAFGGFAARLAWRGRRVLELSADLRQAVGAAFIARRRQQERFARLLGTFDPRHRLAAIGKTLATSRARLDGAVARQVHAARSRFQSQAGRLEGLSPLAVLARGYAVCWDDARTRIVRDAGSVAPGERIRVTLERGELAARVERPAGPREEP